MPLCAIIGAGGTVCTAAAGRRQMLGYRAGVRVLFVAWLAVGNFASVTDAQIARLNKPSAFNTQGAGYSDLYQKIYLGRFDELRTDPRLRSDFFEYIYTYSVAAYGRACRHFVAADSPTIRVTRTTTDGWGNEIDTQSREFLVDTRFAAKAESYGLPFLRDRVGEEILTLVERNGCLTAHTIQYLENLLRYANGQPSIQVKMPEPIPRYRLLGDELRARRTPSGERVRIATAMNLAMEARYLDSSSISRNKMYAERSRYFAEAAALESAMPTTMVLACSYLDPSGSTGSHAYYYWQEPKPAVVTDVWLKTLSPENPFRKIGAARTECPAKEPYQGPHPADIRAKLPVAG